MWLFRRRGRHAAPSRHSRGAPAARDVLPGTALVAGGEGEALLTTGDVPALPPPAEVAAPGARRAKRGHIKIHEAPVAGLAGRAAVVLGFADGSDAELASGSVEARGFAELAEELCRRTS